MSYLRCDGTLTSGLSGEALCDNWVSLTQEEMTADLEVLVLSQLFELMNSVFSTPDPTDIAFIFSAVFSLPVICYLVSSQYGVIINWFK